MWGGLSEISQGSAADLVQLKAVYAAIGSHYYFNCSKHTHFAPRLAAVLLRSSLFFLFHQLLHRLSFILELPFWIIIFQKAIDKLTDLRPMLTSTSAVQRISRIHTTWMKWIRVFLYKYPRFTRTHTRRDLIDVCVVYKCMHAKEKWSCVCVRLMLVIGKFIFIHID